RAPLHLAPSPTRRSSDLQADQDNGGVEVLARRHFRNGCSPIVNLRPREARRFVEAIDHFNRIIILGHAGEASTHSARQLIAHNQDRKSTRLNSSHEWSSY